MRTNGNLWISASVLLAGIGLAGGFFIWPNYRSAAAMNREADELHLRIATLESSERELAEMESQLAKAQERIQQELKIIPTSSDLASLIRKLSQDVDRVSVLDQTFTAGNPADAIVGTAEDKPGVQAMPLTVDMHSTFDAVLALIQNAESLPRLLRVTNVRISCKRDDTANAATNGRSSPLLKSSVSMEAIFDPPADDSSSATASASSKEGR